MCHVILSIPVIGLALFLFLPWPVASAIYVPLLLGSLFVFFAVIKTLRSPITTGPYGLVGSTADVVSKLEGTGPANYLIFCQGETWSAICTESLNPGEKVKIISLRGIRPVIARMSSGQSMTAVHPGIAHG